MSLSHAKGNSSSLVCKMGMEDIKHCWWKKRQQWQPWHPSNQARKALWQAHSVHDLPCTEQAIKWMHAVGGYPIESTWLKAIKAGNILDCQCWMSTMSRDTTLKQLKLPRGIWIKHKRMYDLPSPRLRHWKQRCLPTPQKESERRIHPNEQNMQYHVLWSDRAMPNMIATRQQVHHGNSTNW